MRCPDHATLMMFADDELPADEREPVAQHTAECDACQGFVVEIRTLNASARASLRSIPVDPPRVLVVPRRRRLISSTAAVAAAAAMIAVCLSAVIWSVMTANDDRPVEVAAAPTTTANAPATSGAAQRPAGATVPPLLDEEFDRWAAPHRQRRVPLVPLEAVADFRHPDVPPVGPVADGTVPRS